MGDSHWPVKNEASSDARNSAVAATSSGSPSRWSGVWLLMKARSMSESGAVIGVSMYPGQMALTRMLREPTSRASAFVKLRMAPLAAL